MWDGINCILGSAHHDPPLLTQYYYHSTEDEFDIEGDDAKGDDNPLLGSYILLFDADDGTENEFENVDDDSDHAYLVTTTKW